MEQQIWTPLSLIQAVIRDSGATDDDLGIVDDVLDRLRNSPIGLHGTVEQGVAYAASEVKKRLPKDRQHTPSTPQIPQGRHALDDGSPYIENN